MLVSSFNLSQSFNYTPYLFYKKQFKSEINSFCIWALDCYLPHPSNIALSFCFHASCLSFLKKNSRIFSCLWIFFATVYIFLKPPCSSRPNGYREVLNSEKTSQFSQTWEIDIFCYRAAGGGG